MTLSSYKLSFWMLAAFSGYYITALIISPIYLFFLLSIVIFSLTAAVDPRSIKFDKLVLVPSILLIYIIVSQTFLNPQLSAFVGYLISTLFLIFGIAMIRKLPSKSIIKVSRSFIKITILLLLVDMLYRILNPVPIIHPTRGDITNEGSNWIYSFKINSIMFLDTNFVAILVLSLLFLNLYISKKTGLSYKISNLILALLLLSTFSRAAWIAAVVSFIILKFLRKLSATRVFLLFLVLFTSSLFIYYNFLVDSSFISKFHILDEAINYICTMDPLIWVIGHGLGNTEEFMGIGAHNYILTMLLETGLIGLIFGACVWFLLIWKTGVNSMYIVLPFAIVALSAYSHSIPFVFIALIIIYELERRDRISKKV